MNLDDIQKVIESAVTKAVIEELKTFIGQSVTTAVGLQIANLKKVLDTEITTKVSENITSIIDNPDFGIKLTTSLEDSLRNNSIVWNNIKIPHEAVNFKTFKVSADAIQGGVIENFSSQGIEDQATNIQLTVFDQGVVVENKTLTRLLEVTDSATFNKSMLVNGSLTLKGDLNLNEFALNNLTQKVVLNTVAQLSNSTSSVRLPATVIDFSKFDIPAGRISGTIIKFASSGIIDKATSHQLAITNDGIIVSNSLKASTVEVLGTAKIGSSLQVGGSVSIDGDLIVGGAVALTDKSFLTLASQAASKVQQNLDTQIPIVVASEIEKQLSSKTFDLGAVTIAGAPLLQGRKLANTIIETNIQTLGELKSLTVLGGATIARVLAISPQKKVGINTVDPQYTVDIWDQEVEIAMYKIGNKNGYIGTTRDQILSLGTNNKVAISITPDGTTTVNNLKIGRNSISFADGVPNFPGANGDIVFNTSAKPSAPVGWICLGGTKWNHFSMM